MKKILYVIFILYVLANNACTQSQYIQNENNEGKKIMKYKKWTTKMNGIEMIQILDKRCNCFIVKNDNFCVLIDTSINYERKILSDHLNDLNVKNIHSILLTHSHFDHTGNIQFLQKQYNSNVFIHSLEVQFLKNGYTYLPKGTIPITKLFTSIIGNRIMCFQKFHACDSDKIFTENMFYDIIPDDLKIEMLQTPGHSIGSVCFIVDNEIAIVGDTMVNNAGNIYPPFADFPENLLESWKKLLETNCRLFLPAHGKEIEKYILDNNYSKINEKN